jgi:anionic cell wall polymer biosynthesis LytR-Cps2A-Psr (LCP) family protein
MRDESVNPRRRLIAVVAIGLAATLAWTSLGTFSSASGQTPPIVIDRAHKGAHRPSFTETIYFVIVGGDARTGTPDNQGVDSIHILGIDPVKLRASMLGIPRDTFIEGHKVTDIGRLEGIDGVIGALERFTKCSFDYFAFTAFQGFGGPYWRSSNPRLNTIGGLINELGGVTMKIPSVGLTDDFALERQQPIPGGEHVLNGAQALAWSRARHQLNLRPRGDFDRSFAQGTLMKALHAEMRRDYTANATTAIRDLAVARHYVRMNIPVMEAFRLGLVALRIKPKRVRNEVMNGTTATVNGASIVRPTQEGLNQIADICSDGQLDG